MTETHTNHVVDGTDAAIALCVATGKSFTLRYWNGDRSFEALIDQISQADDWAHRADGTTAAEACLRCWLKWKAAQDD